MIIFIACWLVLGFFFAIMNAATSPIPDDLVTNIGVSLLCSLILCGFVTFFVALVKLSVSYLGM
jgi:hypothetical protein